MENASKALIMAGGILIGILILSLAVYLFADFGKTSAEINEQNAQSQLTQFNSKFTSYEGKEGITIYDIITVASYAKENNDYYENDYEYKIIVKIDNKEIQDNINDIQYTLIKEEQKYITKTNLYLPTYSCKIEKYNNNGRVRTIKFSKN